MLALDRRNEIRDSLREGGMAPLDIRFYVEQYRDLREKSDWRSTRFVETLGEIALHWLNEHDKNYNKDKYDEAKNNKKSSAR